MTDKKSRKSTVIDALIATLVCIVVFSAIAIVSNIDFDNTFGGNSFDTESDFVRIIDVGQGDSILIYSNGYSALIDTGLSNSSAELCTALEACNIEKLDVLLLTHTHSDHIGGAADVTDVYGVKNLILPQISDKSEGKASALLCEKNVLDNGGKVTTAAQGMNFKIGEFEITVLAADYSFDNENDCSVVTAAEISDLKFLFTGDIEANGEKALIDENLNLKADVLKVAHHGSSTSSKEDFIKAVRPRYAAISVGKDNEYAHPHNEVLSLLEQVGAGVYRTDRNGDITFYIENGKIDPKTER